MEISFYSLKYFGFLFFILTISCCVSGVSTFMDLPTNLVRITATLKANVYQSFNAPAIVRTYSPPAIYVYSYGSFLETYTDEDENGFPAPFTSICDKVKILFETNKHKFYDKENVEAQNSVNAINNLYLNK